MSHRLHVPSEPVDVVLDTDTYNEIDDQYAIAYLLRSAPRLQTRAIYAAPFFNTRVTSVCEGMEKSYAEIRHILELMRVSVPVFRGSTSFLPAEETPVRSAAALDLANRAMQYTEERPLYVVAIGAITNIASALLLRPEIARRMVVIWLGGHAYHYHNNREFNLIQDIAAARVVMQSEVAFVQLPCNGVVSAFRISAPELQTWLAGKNPLCDYLVRTTVAEAERYAKGTPWTRCIWDVSAVAWLLNDNERFLKSRIQPRRLPSYAHTYEPQDPARVMRYVYFLCRDALMQDLIAKLSEDTANI